MTSACTSRDGLSRLHMPPGTARAGTPLAVLVGMEHNNSPRSQQEPEQVIAKCGCVVSLSNAGLCGECGAYICADRHQNETGQGHHWSDELCGTCARVTMRHFQCVECKHIFQAPSQDARCPKCWCADTTDEFEV